MCGAVVLFGEVVESYGVEGRFSDAFGAVVDGGDSCLADESGEGSDAACGALVEVGGVPREGAGFVVVEVEGFFDVNDDVPEGVAFTVAGGEAFGEVSEEVGGLGAGGAGVEAVDFVDEDELDVGGGVGVADGVGDLGLGHAGGDGDAEVAGELGDEGFRGGAGRDEDVGGVG